MSEISGPRSAALRPRQAWIKRWWVPIRRQPSAIAGLLIVGAYLLMAVCAPFLATHDPVLQDFSVALQPPNGEHWLGTDSFGQDVYSRVLYGARLALWIGFASVSLGLLGGMSIGLIAGLVPARAAAHLDPVTAMNAV